MVLSGLRGVGKTTLLNNLAEHAERQGWLAITIEARPNEAGIAAVRARLGYELAVGLRRFSRKHQLHKVIDDLVSLARGFTLGVGLGPAKIEIALGGRAASGDIDLDLEELVEAISDVMRKKGAAFGLFIDEMQDLDPDLLGALLAVQHRASQREWPFFVIGAGLPSLPAVLADSRSYAERQFSYRTIGPLSPADAADALRVPVEAHGGCVHPGRARDPCRSQRRLPVLPARVRQGDLAHRPPPPHSMPRTPTPRSKRAVEHSMTGSFRLGGSGPPIGSAGTCAPSRKPGSPLLGPGRSPQPWGVATTAVSDVRDSAIKKGLVWSPEHGRIAFTVPGMADFIRRQPTA